MKVIYTGTEVLEHRTGTWVPGEMKDLPDMAARALLKERGDMEPVGPAETPMVTEETPKPKAKARKKGGGE